MKLNKKLFEAKEDVTKTKFQLKQKGKIIFQISIC